MMKQTAQIIPFPVGGRGPREKVKLLELARKLNMNAAAPWHYKEALRQTKLADPA